MNMTSTAATITQVVFTAEIVSSSVGPSAASAPEGRARSNPSGTPAARAMRLMTVEPPSPRICCHGTSAWPRGLYPAVEDSGAAFRRPVEGDNRHMDAQASLIDLGRPRDLGEILNAAFRLYRGRFSLFATSALAVVVPVDVLIYGVAGEWLWTDRDFGDSLPTGAAVASWLAPWLVTTPLITAGHVHAVMDLGAGRPAFPRRSLTAAARRLTPVAAAVTLAGLGAGLGLIALIVPGVYLWARWYL